MIKAIIFDCFGVLTTEGWLKFKAEHFGDDDARRREASDAMDAADAGLTDYGDFIRKMSEMTGLAERDVRQALAVNVANEELFGFIRTELKPRYKLGMLSNSGANWLPELFSEEQIQLFDAVVLSYQIGAVKPDGRAYRAVCDKLGVEPEECVFIDDQPRYCSAARDFGMQAIDYENFGQCRAALLELLPGVG